jgi:cobalamin-dependent methionine synthase I
VAIEALTRALRQRLGADARRRGFRLTGRLAPGFGDWPLDQQRTLFAAFAGRDLSVHLTEACVMLPRKSVTGVYGLIPITP